MVLIVGFGGGVRITYIDLEQKHQSKIDDIKEKHQYEISLKNDSIQSIQGAFDLLQDEFDLLQDEYNLLGDDYGELQELQDELQDEYNLLDGRYNEKLISYSNLESEYNLLKSGDEYNLHNPTYNEMIDFLERDKTDEISYDDETFYCLDYAIIVNNNAESKGIRCCVVELHFNYTAHAIIGFDTVDKGFYYVEPQSDIIIKNLEIGDDYEYAGFFDITIERIFIYW